MSLDAFAAAAAREKEVAYSADRAEALNEIGLRNAAAAFGQEEYIRIFHALMALQPFLILVLYQLDMLDAII
jgi:hypothetical protein